MKKILFVEDDLMIIRVYRGKFQMEGFEVEVATDGEAALEALKKSVPGLVLLDLQLPKVNGIEILKHIRATPALKHLPVVVFSNAFIGNSIEEAWKAGATKCLTKASCTPSQLLDVITATLAAASPTGKGAPPLPGGPTPGKPGKGGLPTVVIPASNALSDLAREATAWSASIVPSTGPTIKHAADAPPEETDNAAALAALSRAAARPGAESPPGQWQELVRKMFLDSGPPTLAMLRTHLLGLMRGGDEDARLPVFNEVFRALHSLTGNAGAAGFKRIGQMSSALEALVQELQNKPRSVTPSMLRTLALGVDVLGALFQNSGDPALEACPPALALVVDDEAICRRAVAQALDKAGIKSVALDNPEIAFRVLEQNPFEVIFLDVEMPDANGFDLSTRLRALPHHQQTPVVFVTSQNDFESRTKSTLSGGADIITKPFTLIELTVKALAYVLKGSVTPRERAREMAALA